MSWGDGRIRLIDVKKDSPVLNEQILEKKITKKTKVIIPVHFHGHACNMMIINKIANKLSKKTILIADSKEVIAR